MTGYTAEELGAGWEFKILRSATNKFKDPAFLRSTLEEEAKAGWTMVEKFDNARVRLKRPAAAHSGDAALGFDAYRSHVGISENQMAFVIMGSVIGALVILGLVVWGIAAMNR